MKKMIQKLWPIGIVIVLWLVFSFPYFAKHQIPFPSSYLVSFFPPWNISYGMPVKNNAMPDVITQIYPWKKLTIDTWKSGAIPLWNPYSFSGTPHAANYQSAVFSPLNFLFLLLPFIDAWSIMILLQPLIAGIGMYLFLRILSRSRTGSLIGAIGFMFCSFMTTWMAYGTLGYAIGLLPWALWSIASDFRKRSIYLRIFLSVFITCSFLSGHFQISLYVLATILLFIVFELAITRRTIRGLELLFYVFLGILLSAPQLLLTFDAYQASTRSTSFIKGEVIPWQYIVTLFAPDFYGNPVTRNDWFGHYAEWGSYIGVVPLVLAIVAIVRNIKGYKKFFIPLAVASILFAYPTICNDLLFRLKLPAISTSAASRIIVLLSFSLASLSAFGLDDIREYWKTNTKKPLIVASIITLSVIVLVWLIIVLIKPFSSERLVIGSRNLILPSIISIGVLFCLYIGLIKHTWLRGVILFCLIALTAFDMYRFASKWMPFDPKEFVYPQEKSLTYLETVIGNDRMFGNIGNEVGGVFSFPLIEGYDALYQGRYAEFINALSQGIVTPGDRSVVQFDKHGMYKTEGLQLLGVRYIYHRLGDGRQVWTFPYWEYTSNGSMRQVYSDDKYWIYEYSDAYPRAFLASSYKVATNDREIIDFLFAKDINRRETLILEEKPLIEPEPGAGIAEITSYKPNSVRIETKSSVSKLLFLSDVFDAGWRATVDGKESKIYRADYDFRAISVPAGNHLVEFSYMPNSFTWGALLSGFALILLGIRVLWKKIYENRYL